MNQQTLIAFSPYEILPESEVDPYAGRWQAKSLGVDVSLYQPGLGYNILKAGGVKFLMARVGRSGWNSDPQFANHCQGAYDIDVPFTAYYWHDPMVYDQFGTRVDSFPPPDKDPQLQHLIQQLRAGSGWKAFHAVMIDVEQYWTSWDEWAAGDIKSLVTPINNSVSAQVFAGRVKDWLVETFPGRTIPVIIYTGLWFVNSYCKPLLNWIHQYPVCLADYRPTPKVSLDSWARLPLEGFPREDFSIPTIGTKTRTEFWQWSGGQVKLPLKENDVPRGIDLQFFDGDEAALHQFFGFIPRGSIPPDEEPPDDEIPDDGTGEDPWDQTWADRVEAALERIEDKLDAFTRLRDRIAEAFTKDE